MNYIDMLVKSLPPSCEKFSCTDCTFDETVVGTKKISALKFFFDTIGGKDKKVFELDTSSSSAIFSKINPLPGLIANLIRSKQMNYIGLRMNKLGDMGFKTLVDALKSNKQRNLILDIAKNEITGKSMPALVEVIKGNLVRGLLISGNEINEKNLKELNELFIVSKLRVLTVSSNLHDAEQEKILESEIKAKVAKANLNLRYKDRKYFKYLTIPIDILRQFR